MQRYDGIHDVHLSAELTSPMLSSLSRHSFGSDANHTQDDCESENLAEANIELLFQGKHNLRVV